MYPFSTVTQWISESQAVDTRGKNDPKSTFRYTLSALLFEIVLFNNISLKFSLNIYIYIPFIYILFIYIYIYCLYILLIYIYIYIYICIYIYIYCFSFFIFFEILKNGRCYQILADVPKSSNWKTMFCLKNPHHEKGKSGKSEKSALFTKLIRSHSEVSRGKVIL